MPVDDLTASAVQQLEDNAVEKASQPALFEADREIKLLDLLMVVALRKRTIAAITLGFVLITGIVSLFMPNIYTATTVILPPQQSQSLSSLVMGQGGPLAALAGRELGFKNPSYIYAAILKSRTVEDALIHRFDLMKVYNAKYLADARLDLEETTDIVVESDGLISVSVEDKDPKRAAELANGYAEELGRQNQELAVTEASQRRRFFEEQLKRAKDDLSSAELELKKTQEATGLIHIDSQARVILESVANLRAQVAAKEVQLESMRAFATQQNPDLVRTQRELSALRAQLARLERSRSEASGASQVPTGKLPAAALEYVRRLRDVKYQETIFEIMAKQYEIAKLEEAKSGSLIQILDRAVEPEKKSKPQRLFMLVMAALVGCIIGIFCAFLQEAFVAMREKPGHSAKLKLIRAYLLGNRGAGAF